MKWYFKTYIGVFLAFLYLPIITLMAFSFNDTKGRTFTGFTFNWYIKLFHNEAIMNALWTTLVVAMVSSIIATIMGTAAAIGLERLDKRLKTVVMQFTYVPIINPEIITGVSFMLLFVTSKKILANVGIDFEFGWITLIIAHITFNIPYVILNVLPKLRQLDKSIVDAAMDLGCDPVKAFFKVTIHEIRPGIVAGFLMSLTFSMDDFVVSYFTTGAKQQTLSVLIYAMTKRRVNPQINALSAVIFIVILLILIAVNLAERKEAGKKQRYSAIAKGTAAMGVFALTISIVAVISSPVYATSVNYDKEYYSKFKNAGISINVYNWGEYIANGEDGYLDVNKEFEKLTGIAVNYSNFETNEGMYAKLKSGANVYDVVFPSDYMISRLIQEDLLSKINFNNVPNIKNIDKRFLKPRYDPSGEYSIPYSWGRVGIIYNKKLIGKEVNSLDELWNSAYAGQVLMFKNPRDAFAIALEKLGYSMNTEKKEELDNAAELLKKQKPLVQAYVMDQIFDKMQGNEAIIAPYYVGDYFIMKEVNPDLACYVSDKANIYFDAACIPKNTVQKEAAEMYINFLNEPEIAKENALYIMYSTPNVAAWELLPKNIKENDMLYPKNLETEDRSFVHLSEKTNLYLDQLWVDILSEDASYFDWVMPIFVVFSIAFLIINGIRKRRKRNE
ncbi:MAG: extracellular solute-binding protein [Eubacteriales bacterium]